ncbi:MAG: L-rhamnose mutarotase [Thalassotalea sp.]
MEKIAFTMTLIKGNEAEYKKRHDEIWPELVTELKAAGVSDYSIFHDQQSNTLFAVLKREDNHNMDNLPLEPIVKKWWRYMADIMLTNEDNSPITQALDLVFHLD